MVAGGTLVGTIADVLLSNRIPALKSFTHVTWHPSFDLVVIQFSMVLTLAANWGTLVGFVVGILYMQRKK